MKKLSTTLGLDIILSFVGIGIAVIAIFISDHYGLNRSHLGYAVFIACLIYIANRKRMVEQKS